jgi:large subunit ribosomal protein L25
MGLVKINVYNRNTSGKNENRRTRAAGYIPAVLYGNEREATMVQLETTEFTRIMQKSGGSAVIFDLQVEGEDDNPIALMRELQQHPVTSEYRHVDLLEIPRGVPVEVEVSIQYEGEPQVVKFNEGAVMQLIDTVTVNCLPRELPEAITVDISELELNDSIYVKDLTTPAGEIVTDPEIQVLVVKAVSLFVEEEVVAEGEEGAEAAEGEEGAEGGEAGGGDEEKSDD